jgi:hypothetical protein
MCLASPRVCSLLVSVSFVLTVPAGLRAERPEKWGGGGKDYDLNVATDVKHGGQASGSVKSKQDKPARFGALTQTFRADDYRGKRLRLSAYLRSEKVDGWAGLWMRVDGKERTGIAFDNMAKRPVKGTTDWKEYEIVLDVPETATDISFGLLLSGGGQVWVDDIALKAVERDVETTGRVPPAPPKRVRPVPKNLADKPANLDFETGVPK